MFLSYAFFFFLISTYFFICVYIHPILQYFSIGYCNLYNNSGQKKYIKTVHYFWKKKYKWVLRVLMGFETLIRMLSSLSFASFCFISSVWMFFQINKKVNPDVRFCQYYYTNRVKLLTYYLASVFILAQLHRRDITLLITILGRKKNKKTVHNFWKKKDNWVLRFF